MSQTAAQQEGIESTRSTENNQLHDLVAEKYPNLDPDAISFEDEASILELDNLGREFLPRDARTTEQEVHQIVDELQKILKPLTPPRRVEVLSALILQEPLDEDKDVQLKLLDLSRSCGKKILIRAVQNQKILNLLGKNTFEGAQNLLNTFSDKDIEFYYLYLCTGFQDNEVRFDNASNKDTLIVSDDLVNPFSFLVAEKIFSHPQNLFNFSMLHYRYTYRDYLVALGHLYGKFDDDPNATYFRLMVIDAGGALEDLQIVDNFPETRESLDRETPGLKKLKSFWQDIFVAYWSYTSFSQGYDSARPIHPHATRTHTNPIDTFQAEPERGQAVLEGNLAQVRSKLNRKALELVHAYFPVAAVDNQQLSVVFNHSRAEHLFPIIALKLKELEREDSQTSLEEIADILVASFGDEMSSNQLLRLFGPEFLELSAEEKVGLIVYLTFLGNGTVINDSRNVVGAVQDVLLPRLEHFLPEDPNTYKVDDGYQFPADFSEENWLRKKQPALARLKSSTIADGLIWTKDNQLNQQADLVKQAYANSWQMTTKKFEKQIQKIGVFQQFHEEVGSYIYLPLVLFLAGLVQSLADAANFRIQWGMLYTIISAFSTYNLIKDQKEKGIRRHFSKFVDPLTVPSEEELDNTRAQITQSATAQTKRELWDEKYLTAMLLSLYFVGSLAGSLVKNNIHPSGGVNIKVPEILAKRIDSGSFSSFSNYDFSPSNEDSELPLGEPRFATWGVKENLFWNQAKCSAVSTQDTNLNCSSNYDVELNMAEITSYGMSEREIISEISQLLEDENIVIRRNLDTTDLRVEIPVGYKLKRVLSTSKKPKNDDEEVVKFASGYGVELEDQFKKGETFFVYEKQPVQANQIIDSENVVHYSLETSSIDWEKMPMHQQLIERARKQAAEGVPTQQILENIKLGIQQTGVQYGFQKFPNLSSKSQQNMTNPGQMNLGEKFEELVSTNPDGSVKYHHWDCDLFAFATYIIASSADLPVGITLGTVQDARLVQAGNSGYGHAMVVYKEEPSGPDFAFEATLPSVNGYQQKIPVEQTEYPEQKEESIPLTENQLMISLAIILSMPLIVGSISISSKVTKRYQNKARLEAKEKEWQISDQLQSQFAELSDNSKMYVLYLLLSSAGLTGTGDTQQQPKVKEQWFSYHYGYVEQTAENAHHIMSDFAQGILAGGTPNQVAQTKRMVTDLTAKLEVIPDFSSRRINFAKAAIRRMLPKDVLAKDRDKINNSLQQLLDQSEPAIEQLAAEKNYPEQDRQEYDQAVSFLRYYQSVCAM